MSQKLRPDGDITRTNIRAGGDYTSIDEVTASDADYIETGSLWAVFSGFQPATYECSLSDPPDGNAGPGTSTVRWRAREGAAADVTCVVSVVQGSTVIDSASAQALTASYTTYTWNPDLDGVTDWDDLRLRFFFETPNASTSAAARLSWAELEVPDGGNFTYDVDVTETASASDGYSVLAAMVAEFSEEGVASEAVSPAVPVADGLAEAALAGDNYQSGLAKAGAFTETASAADAFSAQVFEPNGWEKPTGASGGWAERGSGGGAWTEVSDTDTDWTEI